MRVGSYDTEDQVWIRDQTARIRHRHILSGKHFRIDLDALLSRVRQLRSSIPADRATAVRGETMEEPGAAELVAHI